MGWWSNPKAAFPPSHPRIRGRPQSAGYFQDNSHQDVLPGFPCTLNLSLGSPVLIENEHFPETAQSRTKEAKPRGKTVISIHATVLPISTR